jgi:hypothetical protein
VTFGTVACPDLRQKASFLQTLPAIPSRSAAPSHPLHRGCSVGRSLRWSTELRASQQSQDEALQWSRRPSTAETPGVQPSVRLLYLLQWSRRPSTAETPARSGSSATAPFFDGGPPPLDCAKRRCIGSGGCPARKVSRPRRPARLPDPRQADRESGRSCPPSSVCGPSDDPGQRGRGRLGAWCVEPSSLRSYERDSCRGYDEALRGSPVKPTRPPTPRSAPYAARSHAGARSWRLCRLSGGYTAGTPLVDALGGAACDEPCLQTIIPRHTADVVLAFIDDLVQGKPERTPHSKRTFRSFPEHVATTRAACAVDTLTPSTPRYLP